MFMLLLACSVAHHEGSVVMLMLLLLHRLCFIQAHENGHCPKDIIFFFQGWHLEEHCTNKESKAISAVLFTQQLCILKQYLYLCPDLPTSCQNIQNPYLSALSILHLSINNNTSLALRHNSKKHLVSQQKIMAQVSWIPIILMQYRNFTMIQTSRHTARQWL